MSEETRNRPTRSSLRPGEMTPEERLNRFTDILAEAVIEFEMKKRRGEIPETQPSENPTDQNIGPTKPRAKEARPPRIQVFLKQAHELKARLENDQGLTQTVLAKEIGISRFELSHNLNLLKLDPIIQKFIFALPPSKRAHPLTKRKLRKIAVIADLQKQKEEFCLLLTNLLGNEWKYTEGSGFFSVGEAGIQTNS